jgi:hypothetical protein
MMRTCTFWRNMSTIHHNARIEAAIVALESQDRINYTEAARKWNVIRSTLTRRYRGETGTIDDASANLQRRIA